MTASDFPRDLLSLWGKSVKASANIAYRTVRNIEKKNGESMRMPVYEATDLRIDGYDSVIPCVILKSPAFWRCKAKVLDTIEFKGTLIKEEGRYIGFRVIREVRVKPFQRTLDDLDGFTEVEMEEDIFG